MVLRLRIAKYRIGERNAEEKRLLGFCHKKLWVTSTWLKRRSKRKQSAMRLDMKLRLILCWLVEATEYLKEVTAISKELQHRLMVTDIDETKLKKVVENEQTFKKGIWQLKENNMKARFQGRVR